MDLREAKEHYLNFLYQEIAELKAALREALEQWESWVNTEGCYPWGEAPENRRIAELRKLTEES